MSVLAALLWLMMAGCAASLPDEDAYKVCAAIEAREKEIFWEDSYTGIGQLGQETEATPIDVPLHPGAAIWYREHGFKV